MTQNKRVDFGWVVQPSGAAEQRDTLRTANQKFLGLMRNRLDSAWLEDHFQWIGARGSNDTLEGWSHLAYLMPLYPELTFGTLVLGQSYRSPSLLAKMASTLQFLSGGRLILGIGAGWKDDEYLAYGWEFPSPAVRSMQLEEYTQIIKLMLTQSPASFKGRYYSIHEAHNDPLPNPPIPLMIGGSGERKTLRTAAKYADWWNSPWRSPDVFAHQVEVLHQHCDAVGRGRDEIVLTTCQMVSLSEDPERAKAHAAPSTMHSIVGNADGVTRELEEFVRLGARHIMIRFRDYPSTEGLELFLEKVLPRFR